MGRECAANSPLRRRAWGSVRFRKKENVVDGSVRIRKWIFVVLAHRTEGSLESLEAEGVLRKLQACVKRR
jgi:hypothetical protein